MKEEFNFRIISIARGQEIKIQTNITIENGILKIEQLEHFNKIKKIEKNATGKYKISDISKIGYSNILPIYLRTMIGLILLLFLELDIIFLHHEYFYGIIYLLFLLTACICCKLSTIKITLKNGVKIHIPIKQLFFETIQDKENAKKLIEIVKMYNKEG